MGRLFLKLERGAVPAVHLSAPPTWRRQNACQERPALKRKKSLPRAKIKNKGKALSLSSSATSQKKRNFAAVGEIGPRASQSLTAGVRAIYIPLQENERPRSWPVRTRGSTQVESDCGTGVAVTAVCVLVCVIQQATILLCFPGPPARCFCERRLPLSKGRRIRSRRGYCPLSLSGLSQQASIHSYGRCHGGRRSAPMLFPGRDILKICTSSSLFLQQSSGWRTTIIAPPSRGVGRYLTSTNRRSLLPQLGEGARLGYLPRAGCRVSMGPIHGSAAVGAKVESIRTALRELHDHPAHGLQVQSAQGYWDVFRHTLHTRAAALCELVQDDSNCHQQG